MKTVIKLFLCALMCSCLLLGMCGCKNDQSDPTENTTTADTEINNDSTEPTEPIYDPLMDTVDGIPRINFESTKDREFNFCLKNNATGIEYPVGYGIKFSTMHNSYGFFVDESDTNCIEPPQTPVSPGKTDLIVESGKDNWFNTFVFGVVNTSNEDLSAEDCDFVYVEFRGDQECSICGVQTNMTYDQVIDILGEPSQEMTTGKGYALTYYVLKNNRAHVIGVRLDEKEGLVQEITLNVGNHPVYVNDHISTD